MLFELTDAASSSERRKAAAALARVFTSLDDETKAQRLLLPLLEGRGGGGDDLNDLAFIRRRIAATSALFLASSSLGVWAVQQSDGMRQLMKLLAWSQEPDAQALAAEVL